MNQIAYQGNATECLVRLMDGLTPVVGLTYLNVTVKMRDPSGTAYVTKTLNTLNFVEFADGFYSIKLATSEVTILGTKMLKVESFSGNTFDTIFSFISVIPNPINAGGYQDLCIISGNIVDIFANPAIGDVISFNAVSGYLLAGNSLLKSTVATTTPDAFGNFSIALIRGVKVKVTIKSAGVNHVITVPNQATALLKDLLPLPA